MKLDPRSSLASPALLLVLTACAGGSPPAAVSPPAGAGLAPAAAAAAESAPADRFAAPYGVDLDTVRAGRFDFGKMWTFEFPPIEYFQETYGFTPDQAWFEKMRLGALRLPNCSASFVSGSGLVMTNHHCARDAVTDVELEGEDLLGRGFYARTRAKERLVEEIYADQLIDLVDVTDEVESRLEGVDDDERLDAQEEVFEELQERIARERGGEDAGIHVEVISLFAGGHYSAYVFRRYENVKLVMAPELQIGFYGGDPDNFTYPRYNLDFSFLRIYDDQDTPVRSENFFRLDDDGLAAGDAVFVIGNPGSTSRLQTIAELEFRRDVSDRGVLDFIGRRLAVLQEFAEAHPDEAERMDLINDIFSLQNSQKAYQGQLAGLADPVIMTKRLRAQEEFQDSLQRPDLAREYGGLIARLAELQELKRAQALAYGTFLGLNSDVYESATLYRALLAFQILNAARTNPDAAARLRTEFRQIQDKHPDLEIALIAVRLSEFAGNYGADADWVQRILQGRTPEQAAREIHARSLLADSATAIAAVEGLSLRPGDPALAVVQAYLQPFAAYQRMLGTVSGEEARISARLGRARMEIYGTERVPPDATFSLRIADGVVEGYSYNGTVAPPFTTLHGLYDRHYSFEPLYADPSESPWALPERWLTVPPGLDLTTEVNFAFTSDIIGGNSGSPVLDQELEVVGLVFDGNMESLPGDYIYLSELNRAVAVDVRGIVEALEEMYEMTGLVAELRSGELVEP